jgi:23S rRNA pseudoU1915 N3-methylase RlmH
MVGTSNSGLSNNIEMFIQAAQLYEDRIIPLSIRGTPIGVNSDITLFLKNDNSQNKEVPFYINGPSGINDNLTFYIKSPGSTSGSIPANDSINMFINRERNDSTDERLALYVGGPTGEIAELPFYIAGAYIANSSVNMFIDGAPIQVTKNAKFYTHGF